MSTIPTSEAFRYTVPRTGDRYLLRFVYRPEFKIFVLEHPRSPFNDSDDNLNHHLFQDKSLCIGRVPPTRKKAIAVGMCWCEGWSRYIRSRDGVFPRGEVSVDVPDEWDDFTVPGPVQPAPPPPPPPTYDYEPSHYRPSHYEPSLWDWICDSVVNTVKIVCWAIIAGILIDVALIIMMRIFL